MREEFQADLEEVRRLLVTMAEAVRAAMRRATTALLTADIEAARAVVARDAEVDALYAQVEAKVADTLARQAPVGSPRAAAVEIRARNRRCHRRSAVLRRSHFPRHRRGRCRSRTRHTPKGSQRRPARTPGSRR